MRGISFQCAARVERKGLHYAFHTWLRVALLLRKASGYRTVRKKEGKKKKGPVKEWLTPEMFAKWYLVTFVIARRERVIERFL